VLGRVKIFAALFRVNALVALGRVNRVLIAFGRVKIFAAFILVKTPGGISSAFG
jgi:hypothetical protein